ncbi:MAG: nitroreductase family protein, partial [Flavobacteriaceae bacterium]|nr:nitroreductase family protein [Flavobacteriaceae bacterium]
MEKTVTEAIEYRRSCRVYKDESIDSEKVKKCIKNATLAPTSSNLQLWEFFHVSDKETLKRLAEACFDQNAATTAQQMVVVVARKDLWRERCKSNIDFLNTSFDKPNLDKRLKKRKKMA